MDVDALLNEWAWVKFKRGPVTHVHFEVEQHEAWSEYTPADGPYMSVQISVQGGPLEPVGDVHYDGDLIREILKWGVERVQSGVGV